MKDTWPVAYHVAKNFTIAAKELGLLAGQGTSRTRASKTWRKHGSTAHEASAGLGAVTN